MLTLAARQALLAAVPGTHLSLHSAYPGATGTSELATSRFPLSWQAPSGSTRISDAISITVPAGLTAAWLGLWSAASGGTFHGSVPLEGEAREYHTLPATDLIVCPGHGFTAGQPVVFWGGTVPAPLVEGTVYYARDVQVDNFRVAASQGGSAINLTADGAGTTFVSRIRVFTAAGETVLGMPRLIVSAVNPAPLVTAPPLAWSGTPAPQFTAGLAATYGVTTFVSDYNAGTDIITLAPTSASLPGGITFNGTQLVASGLHSAGTTANVRLRVTRGIEVADSATFSIAIVAALSWTGTPAPSFVALQPSAYSVTAFVSNYNATTDVIALAPTSAALPAGITFSGTAFLASGSQIAGTTTGVQLRVTRSSETVDSASFVVSVTAEVGVITAASAQQSDVQAAINAAPTGGTVIVPAGAATWSGLTLNKAISLRGAGSGQNGTVLSCSGSTTLVVNGPAAGRMTVSGFRFVGGGSNYNAPHLYVFPSPGTENLRVTDCYFGPPSTGYWGIHIDGCGLPNTGYVLDKCTFAGCAIYCTYGGTTSFESWKSSANIGGRNKAFIEDCIFAHPSLPVQAGYSIDAYRGGQYVFRYNTCQGHYCGTHDTARQGTYYASGRAFEIYSNSFAPATNNARPYSYLDLNSGTGVVFGNTFSGATGLDITFYDYRTNDPRGLGTCNGTNDEDGNAPGQSGWLCQFQIGAKYDGVPSSLPQLDTNTPEVGTSYNHPVHYGAWGQYAASDPVYLWSNTRGGTPVTGVDRGAGGHIQEGRDVINGTHKPSYVPYPYPHPLRSDNIFPLSIHSSGRYFVDAQGNPFFVHGDTPWSFAVRLTNAEIDQYLADRQAKGFNTLLCYPIEHEYNQGVTPAYRNRDGQDPFSPMTNWAQPNEAYWRRVDYFVIQARARGMAVLMNPAFFGFGGGSQGWAAEILAATDQQLITYGAWLANRYWYGNIMWFFGGDYDGDATLRAKQWKIVEGMRTVRTTDLITAHPAPNKLASDVWNATTYPGFNFDWSYAYEKDGTYAYAQIASGYAKSPTKPVVFCEGNYEDEFSVSEQAIRRQAYTSILAGACGHVYGHGIVWPFLSGWQTALNDIGAVQMQYVKNLFTAFRWEKLQPRPDNSLVSSAKGSGTSIVTPALANDGTFGIIYVPSSQTVTIVKSALSPANVRVRLFNPVTGVYTTHTAFTPNTGTLNVATGGERVIVLDAA